MKIKNNTLYYVAYEDIQNGTFIIPDGVTSIGKYVFFNCRELTNIIIPNSVTSIEYRAFLGCSGLKAVYITDLAAWCNIEFESIYANPLYYANKLYLNGELVTNLVIPNTVTEIKDGAFFKCISLTSVTTPESVTSIGDFAFYGCTGLTTVTIGNSVTSIGNYAFEDCIGLTSITIPESVTSIGSFAFHNCIGLTSKKSIYKAFDITKSGKLRCLDKIYTPYKWHIVKGDLKLCEKGIHYCTNLFEIFNYYSGELDKTVAIYECEVKGEDLNGSYGSKHCCRGLKPVKRLSREDTINILNGKENEDEGDFI